MCYVVRSFFGNYFTMPPHFVPYMARISYLKFRRIRWRLRCFLLFFSLTSSLPFYSSSIQHFFLVFPVSFPLHLQFNLAPPPLPLVLFALLSPSSRFTVSPFSAFSISFLSPHFPSFLHSLSCFPLCHLPLLFSTKFSVYKIWDITANCGYVQDARFPLIS